MSKTYQYRPQGVCSQLMEITVNDGILEDLQVLGGCSGNLQGIASLIRGMKVEEVIQRLDGIRCGNKSTSCPDQLAKALKALPERVIPLFCKYEKPAQQFAAPVFCAPLPINENESC